MSRGIYRDGGSPFDNDTPPIGFRRKAAIYGVAGFAGLAILAGASKGLSEKEDAYMRRSDAVDGVTRDGFEADDVAVEADQEADRLYIEFIAEVDPDCSVVVEGIGDYRIGQLHDVSSYSVEGIEDSFADYDELTAVLEDPKNRTQICF